MFTLLLSDIVANNNDQTSFIDSRSSTTNLISDHPLTGTTKDPANYRSIMSLPSPQRIEWLQAIDKELNTLWTEGCFKSVKDINIDKSKKIGSKYVFRTKVTGDKKARLVALGYMELIAQDEVTYSPTVNTTSLRIIFHLLLMFGWKITFVDVRSAFIIPTISDKKELYLVPPPGSNAEPGTLWLLLKTLYGLASSPVAWYNHFADTVLSSPFGFQVSTFDPCVFISENLIVAVHVDDSCIVGEETKASKFVKWLGEQYVITINPSPEYLGMEIALAEDKSTLSITQTRMINAIVDDFGLTNSRGVGTPSTPEMLEPAEGIQQQPRYRELIGKLLYTSTMTRPDLTFATNRLASFCHSNTAEHLQNGKRALRYLKKHPNIGLNFVKPIGDRKCTLKAYCDSSWADNPDRRSTAGYTMLLGGNIIYWKSFKLSTVATSSTEAEVSALLDCVLHVIHIRAVLEELGHKQLEPTEVFVDNQACIMLCQPGSRASKRSRHFEIRMYKIREVIESKEIVLTYINTNENLADGFTKSLPIVSHSKLFDQLMNNDGINSLSAMIGACQVNHGKSSFSLGRKNKDEDLELTEEVLEEE